MSPSNHYRKATTLTPRFRVDVFYLKRGCFLAWTTNPEGMDTLRRVIEGLIAQGALARATSETERRGRIAFTISGTGNLARLNSLLASDVVGSLSEILRDACEAAQRGD